MAPVARAALWLTLWTALLVGILNTFIGTATAWCWSVINPRRSCCRPRSICARYPDARRRRDAGHLVWTHVDVG
jgi:hypothetical protein